MCQLYRYRSQLSISAIGWKTGDKQSLLRQFQDACMPYSLRKQAIAAGVHQISSVVIEQVPPAAPLDLICRTSKRRPPDCCEPGKSPNRVTDGAR